MNTLAGIAAFIAVAAITPGPNNLFVLAIAAEHGWRAALPAIAGIVGGGIALLAAVSAGAAALFDALPALRVVLGVAGCVYLVWLGATLVRQALWPAASATQASGSPVLRGVLALAVFQWLNPKGWLMVLTAVAAMPRSLPPLHAFAVLVVLFGTVSALCLLLWSLLGTALSSALQCVPIARAFDGAMGALLIVSVIPLLPQ